MILSQSLDKEKNNKRNIIIPTNCLICGKSTNCYHYDVISCNGCKTFFRRSILAGKDYKCKFDGNCTIEKRASCKKCRFEKCLSSGMNPMAIHFPSNWTNHQISEILEKYKNYKKSNNGHDYQIEKKDCPTCSYISFDYPSLLESQNIVSNCLKNLTYIEYKFKLLRESVFNGYDIFGYNLDDYLKQHSKLGDAEKYFIPTDWPKPMCKPKEKHIFEITTEELILHRRNFKPRHKRWFSLDEYLVVDYMKTLNFFSQIPHYDKINIVKNIGTLLYVTGVTYYSFVKNKESVYFPDGFEPLKLHKKNHPLEEEVFKNSVNTFYRVKLTNEEYCLLKIIIVCSCTLEDISEQSQKLIEREKTFYSNILLYYLQNKLGTIEGVKRYMEIIMFIQTISRIGEKFKQLNLLFEMAHSRVHNVDIRRPKTLFINK